MSIYLHINLKKKKKLAFRKIASPLGTFSNISPPTCSTPIYEKELQDQSWQVQL